MQISLQKLNQAKDQQVTISEKVVLEDLQLSTYGLIHLNPIDVNVQVTRLNPHLFAAEAEQSTEAIFVCSRCLTHFDATLHQKWQERFTDVEEGTQEDGEDEVHQVEGNVIDLLPYVREAFLLDLPFAPLCQEDCKGLCPKCGINLSIDTCDCQIETIDPRLAKLQELLTPDK